MKKFLCLILGAIIALSMSSCMPPRRESEAEKRNKQIMAEENAKLNEILQKSGETETAEEETVAD